jgi:phosphonate transport system substrate-binding protein
MLTPRRLGAAVAGCLVLLLLPACSAIFPAPTPTPVPDRPIVLADISDEPEDAIAEIQPLADYLAARLADHGITRGEVRVASSLGEMARLMEDGQVDIYFDSVYPATVISDLSGAQPFLRRWKDGVEAYHTVIITTADSGIATLDDLPGHAIAFEEEFSTTGYLLPTAYLVERGFSLAVMADMAAPVEAGTIGYLFSGEDDRSLDWLRAGLVGATAMDNNTYAELAAESGGEFVILAETEALPRHIGLIRPGMEPDLLAAITDALLHAHEDEEGQAALEAFSETARFDVFPEGTEAAMARMRELLSIVQGVSQPGE